MIDRPRKLVLLAVIAVGMLPTATAQAHCCRSSYDVSAPSYHYAVPDEHYAVELATNVYAAPYRLRAFPYMRCCAGRSPAVVETERGIEDAGALSENGKPRVIRAEAEVTILGPDRMNIRLFRKGQGSNIKPRAD